MSGFTKKDLFYIVIAIGQEELEKDGSFNAGITQLAGIYAMGSSGEQLNFLSEADKELTKHIDQAILTKQLIQDMYQQKVKEAFATGEHIPE